MATSERPIRIGVDTGGTFTDLVLFDGRRIHTHKLLSTPADPARAVLEGLVAILKPFAASRREVWIHYGSTVATNAVLERRGARVALLTTEGFEDVIEIGRQVRSDLYALEPSRPKPLVPRALRFGVRERMLFDGKALVPLQDSAARAAIRRVVRARPEAVAICLLHSYANPRHERILARALWAAGFVCSISSELVPEYREFERMSTTVLNAYVAPVMSRHLEDLEKNIVGLPRGRAARRVHLRVMQSSGGLVAVRTAGREAVRTLLSGPAGGVIGAASLARRLGFPRIITVDMGGTSTDVSLVDGAVRCHTEWEVEGLPVKVPALDIHTVGAGGGSIAHVDPGGALKVGPASAGADPGPACYGRGDRPTVTDANVVLGRLVSDAFLDGRMSLDVARARAAVAQLGRTLGLTVETAAEGVIRVVNAGMERAIRRVSVERGHDPRQYTLVAFGGAAGLHACELAAALGCPRVLIPRHPGLLSAWGVLAADVQRDFVQSMRRETPSVEALRRAAAPLVQRAQREMRSEAPGSKPRIEVSVDARYRGQSYEVRIPLTSGYVRSFHSVHRTLYGYADERQAVEIVNLRVTALVKGAAVRWQPSARNDTEPARQRVLWNGRWSRIPRYRRESLPPNLRGPILITELSSTTFVPPRWQIATNATGELILSPPPLGRGPG